MGKNTEDKAKAKREVLQLRRLGTLTDVVYGIVIWNFFTLIPGPDGKWPWDSIGAFLTSNLLTFVLVIVGIVISIIYWLQNNALFGSLERTDARHTALSIFQLFFLLIFLYSIHLGVALGASLATRLFESCAVVLMGVASASAWSYAIKNRRLLMPEVTDQEARDLADRILAEPITAIITIPFAFAGPILWEIAWLSYLLVIRFLRRRRQPRNPVK